MLQSINNILTDSKQKKLEYMRQQIYADENKDFATILKTHKRKTLKLIMKNSALANKIDSEEFTQKDTKGILESLGGLSSNKSKKSDKKTSIMTISEKE